MVMLFNRIIAWLISILMLFLPFGVITPDGNETEDTTTVTEEESVAEDDDEQLDGSVNNVVAEIYAGVF